MLMLVALAAGIFYLKIYEPEAFLRPWQITTGILSGHILSMSAPEAFPEDIYPTYMGYDAVCSSHRIASFSDLSDYLETAFSSGNEVTHVFLVLDPLSLWNPTSLHSDARFSASLDERPAVLCGYLRRCRIYGHFLCTFLWNTGRHMPMEIWTLTCNVFGYWLPLCPPENADPLLPDRKNG